MDRFIGFRKNWLGLCLLLSTFVMGSQPLYGQDLFEKITNSIKDIPEGRITIGILNTETNIMTYGIPNPNNTLRGLHYPLFSRVTGILDPTEPLMPKLGKGKYVGFTVFREGGSLHWGQMSSMKAAGDVITPELEHAIPTMNPLHSRPNPVWHALLGEENTNQVLANLVDEAQGRVILDTNIRGSTRFPFNAAKHPAEIVDTVKAGTEFLQESVNRANSRLWWFNIADGLAPPDYLAFSLNDTQVPDNTPGAHEYARASSGQIEGINSLPKVDDTKCPAPESPSVKIETPQVPGLKGKIAKVAAPILKSGARILTVAGPVLSVTQPTNEGVDIDYFMLHGSPEHDRDALNGAVNFVGRHGSRAVKGISAGLYRTFYRQHPGPGHWTNKKWTDFK